MLASFLRNSPESIRSFLKIPGSRRIFSGILKLAPETFPEKCDRAVMAHPYFEILIRKMVADAPILL
jgi:hypothetical protein